LIGEEEQHSLELKAMLKDFGWRSNKSLCAFQQSCPDFSKNSQTELIFPIHSYLSKREWFSP
jgi:hypothetical protein